MGCRGAESPGWFDVSPKNSARDVMHEWVCCHDEAASHQLPIAIAFRIIRIVSIEECSSLTQNLMQIYPFTCSVILNAVATQYTCSLNGIYCPYWLVQWSRHCSHMCVPVHSPWLSDSNNVAHTVLVIVTMVVHFPDRSHIYSQSLFEKESGHLGMVIFWKFYVNKLAM